MKILTILGARPQFIKAGAVSRAIKQYNSPITNHQSLFTNHSSLITEIIAHTGQHYDKNMSDVFFEELHLPKPHYNLGVGGKSQGAMTGAMIIKLEEVMIKEKPDIVMVYGDTNSTLAGAITASKLHIPIAHVEAGLRSFNMKMPEEINRVLTDRVSSWLFCPTETAVENLKKEGFPFKLSTNHHQLITNVGDVMYDAALYYKNFSKPPTSIVNPSTHLPIYPPHQFILCTVHRAENTDDSNRLKAIFGALIEISKDTPIILPLHPRTLNSLKQLLPKLYDSIFNNTRLPMYSSTHLPLHPSTHLLIIEPVGYLEMIWLLDNCSLVMTDSGGLQKEAFFFKKPCITLRNETEWVELIENGENVLVGADEEKIIEAYKKHQSLFTNNYSLNLYGDGKASEKILRGLLK